MYRTEDENVTGKYLFLSTVSKDHFPLTSLTIKKTKSLLLHWKCIASMFWFSKWSVRYFDLHVQWFAYHQFAVTFCLGSLILCQKLCHWCVYGCHCLFSLFLYDKKTLKKFIKYPARKTKCKQTSDNRFLGGVWLLCTNIKTGRILTQNSVLDIESYVLELDDESLLMKGKHLFSVSCNHPIRECSILDKELQYDCKIN